MNKSFTNGDFQNKKGALRSAFFGINYRVN